MNMHILLSCLTIFCCRIIDVSLGTIRTILTVKERTLLSSIIGFMEVFIWYIIVKDALTGDTPVLLTAISYAGGYATGTFVGGKLAGALVSGQVTMQVVTSHRDPEILAYLRSFGYGLTVLNVEAGRDGVPKHLILSTIDRKQVRIFRDNIERVDPKAMIMIQSTVSRVGGYDRAKILTRTCQLAKRQDTWFRHQATPIYVEPTIGSVRDCWRARGPWRVVFGAENLV